MLLQENVNKWWTSIEGETDFISWVSIFTKQQQQNKYVWLFRCKVDQAKCKRCRRYKEGEDHVCKIQLRKIHHPPKLIFLKLLCDQAEQNRSPIMLLVSTFYSNSGLIPVNCTYCFLILIFSSFIFTLWNANKNITIKTPIATEHQNAICQNTISSINPSTVSELHSCSVTVFIFVSLGLGVVVWVVMLVSRKKVWWK